MVFTSSLAGFDRCLCRPTRSKKIVGGRILYVSFEAARNSSFAVAVAVPPLSIVSVAPVLVIESV